MTLSRLHPSTALYHILSPLRNRNVVFAPHPGNAGDALIAVATYQLLDQLLPAYHVCETLEALQAEAPGSVVILAGGGNLINQSRSNSVRNRLERTYKVAEQVILLPHTITGNIDMLARLPSSVHIFCREVPSFEHTLQYAPSANVYLEHDLAFFLDPTELPTPGANAISNAPRRGSADLARGAYSSAMGARITLSGALARDSSLNCFRTDKEVFGRIPRANYDIPRLFKRASLAPVSASRAAEHVLRALNSFKTIRTNRLHMCIAGTLLGKTVRLHPNNYYKNRAVYEYSLSHYGNVLWVD